MQSMPGVLGRWHRPLHGHFLRDDTAENKKYIKSVLDLFSIPNFYIRKGRPHGHRYGKKEGCNDYHTAKQLQKRCRKKQYENIPDRFIRDTWFDFGRSTEQTNSWSRTRLEIVLGIAAYVVTQASKVWFDQQGEVDAEVRQVCLGSVD